MKKIDETDLGWRDNAPVSAHFSDVYYSAENGLAETNYVFLHGVGVPDSWQGKDHFVIAETGFGTGLNFLATWKAFRESGATGRLTFISAEGYPLTERALKAAHETFPEIAQYAAELRAAWPPAAKGFHKRHFDDGKINLLLLFGDAAASYARLRANVDAWFLDGFAPAKNPEMWSDALFDEVARLSKPGARFATFTAAGFVRRGLAARGFEVAKVKGYGRKRERLIGTMADKGIAPDAMLSPPEWACLPSAKSGPIAVIGGGIAGASVAAALNARGREVTLFAPNGQTAASNVPAAILAPRFVLDDQPISSFFYAAYAYSSAFAPYREAWAAHLGLTVLPKNAADAARLKAIASHLEWSQDWLAAQNQGIYLPRGGSLDTAAALQALKRQIDLRAARVTGLAPTSNGWRLRSAEDRTEFAHVVIACGLENATLLPDGACPDLRPNRGQVEILRDTADLPDASLAYGGYLTAAVSGNRTLGSTFDRLACAPQEEPHPSNEDRARIIEAYETVTGEVFPATAITESWAGVRATTPDHLPYTGPAYDAAAAAKQYEPLSRDANTKGLGAPPLLSGLSMLTGLGSKGYQYGPILADYLAASLCDEPLPLPTDQVAALHPMRGLIRSIVRGQSSSRN